MDTNLEGKTYEEVVSMYSGAIRRIAELEKAVKESRARLNDAERSVDYWCESYKKNTKKLRNAERFVEGVRLLFESRKNEKGDDDGGQEYSGVAR